MHQKNKLTRREFVGRSVAAGTVSVAAASLGQTATRAADNDQGEADGPWQIGCYTRPWDQYDYRTALDAIAEAGYKHAGLMTTKSPNRLVLSVKNTLEEAGKIGEEVRSRGLEIPSVYGGGIPVSESLEAGIEGMKRLIDNCVAAGAKSLLMGGTNDKLFDVYYRAIAESCDYAAEKGLPITVKPHGGRNSNGAECRQCVEKVGHENFRVWYDPGNIYFYSDGELSPVEDAPSVADLVIGMCVKDFKKDPKRDVWVTPGTGWVDFPALMKKLKQGGFTGGPLVVECFDRGDGDLKTLLRNAKITRQFVEELVGKS